VGSLSGFFALLGVQAAKIKRWPYVVGFVVYGADTLTFWFARSLIGFALHVAVFVAFWRGWAVARAIGEFVQAARLRG